MIRLVKDTINRDHIKLLIEWLKTNPKLTKGNLTLQFEDIWSKWLGVKYSVFVNSGSSANLLMIYSLILSGRLRNNNVIVPAISWSTTVAPTIQFGLNPIICDCDNKNLGLNISHLKQLVEKYQPSIITLVHVLGIPNYLDEITKICHDNDIILLEDTCEAVGSTYHLKRLGTFGVMSSFSFYFGHHISTIEGGMISTNDEELYSILLSIRSHGWDRDLPNERQKLLRQKYKISEFKSLYTFYYPGFNLRATDLQAFIGIEQMKDIDSISIKRNKNFSFYNELLNKHMWKIKPPKNCFVSNFAYPLITRKINKLITNLKKEQIEHRPLICGSIAEQPFWYNRYDKDILPNASKVNDFGIYLPNHHELSYNQIEKICHVVNNT
jgi:CDP-6-deoxy-D-xylo-4-hexulose-3-dehydrase